MKNLDSLDRRILRELQKDGRLSNTELSERISLSQTATTERVKRLTRDGYILGYTAKLSPKKLDRAMLVFVEIKLDRTTPDVFATFAAATRRAGGQLIANGRIPIQAIAASIEAELASEEEGN